MTPIRNLTRTLPYLLGALLVGLVFTLPASAESQESEDHPGDSPVICPEGLGPESGMCYIDDSHLHSSTGSKAGIQSEGNQTFSPQNIFRQNVVCFGDGQDGRRVQLVYLRPDTSNASAPTSRIRSIAASAATTFEESSSRHGGPVKTVRFTHDANCRPTIITASASALTLDGGYYTIVERLRELGLNRSDRKYLVFIDYPVPFCGLGTHYADQRSNPKVNQSNNLTGYGLNGIACWEKAATHELIHTLGAVSKDAPNSTGAGHCVDDHDIMCYQDQSGKKTVIRCKDFAWEYLLDCGGDDYFNPKPAPGSYLATHWNVYNSSYLSEFPTPEVSFSSASVGLYDPAGRIRVFSSSFHDFSETSAFYYGNPGDVLFSGDWDCDGVPTPGLYRRSNGYVYLRNSNTAGVADIAFYFGNPGDLPVAGDFNGDGCDTVSVYRPSNATFYIINKLGKNGKGLGAADYSFVFGHVGDVPFVGDFNGDGIDTVGLHRPSTGQVFLRNSLSAGWADLSFVYGNPGDLLTAGDWDGDGKDTVAVYRPSNQTLYLKNSNQAGWADLELPVGPATSIAAFRPRR